MDIKQEALQKHEEWKGKFDTVPKMEIKDAHDLSLAYTPGVAEPCKKINENPEDVYRYTMKGNMVAVVTDGTAVLGLGDIGPEAGLPVMEGKAVLFKAFAGVNAFPICLKTKDTDEIVNTVKLLEPSFGAVNLEDIAAPRCFDIEERLKKELNIPVFHDDQHGTAIVVLAAMINALKFTGKDKNTAKVVVNGAGSAGTAISKLLLNYGLKNLLLCDKQGIIHKEADWTNWSQKKMAEITNPENLSGTLKDAMKGADIFVGVSAPNIVTEEMIQSMNKDPIVFPMANPVPEIMPDLAKKAGAKVVGTGRSDFPNQVNNVLAFPGIFKGVLESRAPQITEEMKVASAVAIAGMVPENELNEENIIPKAFNPNVAGEVAKAVAEVAAKSK